MPLQRNPLLDPNVKSHTVMHTTERLEQLASDPRNTVYAYREDGSGSVDVQSPRTQRTAVEVIVAFIGSDAARGVPTKLRRETLAAQSPTVARFAATAPKVFNMLTHPGCTSEQVKAVQDMLDVRARHVAGELTETKADEEAMTMLRDSCVRPNVTAQELMREADTRDEENAALEARIARGDI